MLFKYVFITYGNTTGICLAIIIEITDNTSLDSLLKNLLLFYHDISKINFKLRLIITRFLK